MSIGVMVVAALPVMPAAAQATGTTERVSLASSGAELNASSAGSSVSPNGRFVAFTTYAAPDGNAGSRLYVAVRDLEKQTTRWVRRGSTAPNGDAQYPTVANDGTVAFISSASNLVSGDTNGKKDAFVSKPDGTIVRVSTRSNGAQTSATTAFASISADGRYVGFVAGSGFEPGADPGVYRKDRTTGTTRQIATDRSLSTSGEHYEVMSPNGRWFVANGPAGLWRWDANEASPAGQKVVNEKPQFYAIADNGTVAWIALSRDDAHYRTVDGSTKDAYRLASGSGPGGEYPNFAGIDISADGNSISYISTANNLQGGSTGRADVYRHSISSNTTEIVGRRHTDGTSSQDNYASDLGGDFIFHTALSADGSVVTWSSAATDLVPCDGNGRDDVFVRGPGVTGTSNADPSDCPAPTLANGQRLAGEDRYETAATIVAEVFPDPVDTVYVASAVNFPDALAATAVAGATDAPVLLVPATCADERGCVPRPIAEQLGRLDPDTTVIVGGPAAIDTVVQDALENQLHNTVVRVAGADRYDTAAQVVDRAFTGTGGTVYLASGTGFPDALSAGPAAIRQGAALLLTERDVVPGPTRRALQRLQPDTVVLVGGTGVISDAIADQVEQVVPGTAVSRHAGLDRYATSAEVTGRVFTTADTVLVATGTGFADALAGGPAAGRLGAPLLLVPPTGAVPQVVVDQLRALGADTVVALGGPAAIDQDVIDQLVAATR